jgi:UPF0716 family protein affecting phage T7 exclusion
MDYNLDIVLIALVFHREVEGGGSSSVSAFATSLFNRFDNHIRQGAASAGITLTADQRTVIAAIALMVPGTTSKERALEALATFMALLGS